MLAFSIHCFLLLLLSNLSFHYFFFLSLLSQNIWTHVRHGSEEPTEFVRFHSKGPGVRLGSSLSSSSEGLLSNDERPFSFFLVTEWFDDGTTCLVLPALQSSPIPNVALWRSCLLACSLALSPISLAQ
jgi:hypothetical protein